MIGGKWWFLYFKGVIAFGLSPPHGYLSSKLDELSTYENITLLNRFS